MASTSTPKASLMSSPSLFADGLDLDFDDCRNSLSPSFSSEYSLDSSVGSTPSSSSVSDLCHHDISSKMNFKDYVHTIVPLQESASQRTITASPSKRRPAKLKKKRSLGQTILAEFSPPVYSSLSSSPEEKTVVLSPTPYNDNTKLSGDTITPRTIKHAESPQDTSDGLTVESEDEDSFDDQNRTVRRRNMPHHPFRREDAPYMQAYSPALLENDYHTFDLLRRLSPDGSPTFHAYGRKPPSNVLDLGCGEGFWVLHAAKVWKSAGTKVTGLDLIDVHNNHAGEVLPQLEAASVPKNVTWTRGNFVKYDLPFPDNSFDLVRMANLSLCIPYDRWEFVITQVRRVLKPEGRLELIDDRLFFPDIPPSASSFHRSPSFKARRVHFEDDSDEEDVVIDLADPDDSSSLPIPTFASSKDIKQTSSELRKRHTRSRSQVEYEVDAGIARHLETIFENMLIDKYGILPRPREYIHDVLRDIFGGTANVKSRTLQLAVPPRELFESGCDGTNLSASSQRSDGDAWPLKIVWDKKEAKKGKNAVDKANRSSQESIDEQCVLGSLSPKAVRLLLGDNQTKSSRANLPFQPPGLLLLPSTLVPFSPLELEMHACKNMNVLLGCRNALTTFVLDQTDECGVPLIPEEEFDDYLWDYDRQGIHHRTVSHTDLCLGI
ncbi:hypothetical protein AcV7_001233 [Taiwanofungus camphoratus]|nr:hypothetical protein AcV7_001233 [Antrodia cinnamomea]